MAPGALEKENPMIRDIIGDIIALACLIIIVVGLSYIGAALGWNQP